MSFILVFIIFAIIISLSSSSQTESVDEESSEDNQRNDVVTGSSNYSRERSYLMARGSHARYQEISNKVKVVKQNHSVNERKCKINKPYECNQEIDSAVKLLMRQSSRDVGYSIKQVLQGCHRTTPFSNKNVVATVAFMSLVGTVVVQEGSPESFNVYCGIKESVCRFASGEMSWSDFVKVYWDVTRSCKLSNTVADSILTYFEEMAYEIMDYVDANGMRGDLHWGPMRSILGK